MDKQLVKKITTVSFLTAAVLSWLAVTVVFRALAGSFGVVQRLYGIEVINHGLPLVVGVGVFLYLQLNSKAVTLAEEVIHEVSKVVWPSRKDTVAMTIVVIIMVLFASLVLWGIDLLSREVVKLLVQLPTIFG